MCGLAGVFNARKAAEKIYVLLHSEQHRAKDYAGIASSDGSNLFCHKGSGIVQDIFSQTDLDRLHGLHAIGHVRYSTVNDDPDRDNAQPLVYNGVALAHNGNIYNCKQLQPWVEELTGKLATVIDSEIPLRLFCQSQALTIEGRVFDAVKHLKGSYCLLILFDDTLVAVRDPFGNRPLSLGHDGDSWFLASETVAFDVMMVKTVRDILPGEILILDKSGQRSVYFDESGLRPSPPHDHQLAQCKFCLDYYSHPGSVVFGENVLMFQRRCGQKLWQEHPVASGNIVVGIPDSAIGHAEGLAREAGLYLERVLTRHHYVGRTFIEPSQGLRDTAVLRKFLPIKSLVEDGVVILVDDSIVRLTTLPGVVRLLRWLGAREIHARISAPRIFCPCFYGIDTPTKQELIAANLSNEEIARKAGVDSLEFLSVESFRSLVSNPDDYCYACMTGQYRIR